MNLFRKKNTTGKPKRFQPQIETLEDRLAMSGADPLAVPPLHSNPGAPNTLYLNFRGIEDAYGSNDGSGGPNVAVPWGPRKLPAFDLDGDTSSFSPLELDVIRDVHQRVAEDFAPFNIDVTTVDPSPGVDFTARQNTAETRIWRISIAGDSSDLQIATTDIGGSDVIHGYAGSVWAAKIGNDAATLANTASHEAGHNMGLSHKPDYDSNGNWLNWPNPYGVGGADWTAIMGDTNENDRTIWNNSLNDQGIMQDDIAKLTALLGSRPDDHSASPSRATSLGDLSTGSQNSYGGVIGTLGDHDMFKVYHPGGRLEIKARGFSSFSSFESHGVTSNLDIALRLRDTGGYRIVATSNPANSLEATIDTNRAPGWYYIEVYGVGNSMGHFNLSVKGPIKGPKKTLGDTSVAAPAAVQLNGTVYTAWSGTDKYRRINVMASNRLGNWYNKVTLWDQSTTGVALTAFNNRLYMAWTGLDRRLNVMSSADGLRWTNKITLGESSYHRPALAAHGGRLVLSWVGTDRRLNLLTSYNGKNWFGKRVLGDTTVATPALASFNGRLYLAWTGTNANRNLNIMSTTSFGATWQNRRMLADTSSSGPSLLVEGSKLRLAWAGTDSNRSINVLTSYDGFYFFGKMTLTESSHDTPTLTMAYGGLGVVWTGTDAEKSLNILRI